MNSEEFAKKHNLSEAMGLDSANKVELGYFKHTIVRNNEEYVIVTLSRELSLFVSRLSDEDRYRTAKAFSEEVEDVEDNVLHIVHKNKHLLATMIGNNRTHLHIEQRS